MAKAIKVAVLTQAEGPHLELYLPALRAIDEAVEVGLADPSGRTVDMARQRLGNKLKNVAKDASALLREYQPHMALITLEAAKAPPVIDAALDAGCHVFAEKPSCVRAEDFEPLARKAEQKHRHLMLALANRAHPLVQEARRLVRDGALGKLYGVEAHFLADQSRLKSAAYRQAWFCSKSRAGGGHLIWLGIHWLDLVLYITGRQAEQAIAFTGTVGGQPIEVEDAAALALRFDNGVFGTLTSGYYLDRGKDAHLQIWGEDGWLRLGNLEDNTLEWYSPKYAKSPKVQRYQAPPGERGYTPFVRAAVRACAGLEPAPISPQECVHVLRTIFAAYRAAQTGRVQGV